MSSSLPNEILNKFDNAEDLILYLEKEYQGKMPAEQPSEEEDEGNDTLDSLIEGRESRMEEANEVEDPNSIDI